MSAETGQLQGQGQVAFAIRALFVALSTAAATVSLAQPVSEPSQGVKLVVPFAAGTPVDSIARALAANLSKPLGQNVIVDNKPGAAANIGTESVSLAPADGQTLLVTVNSPITINPLLYSKLRHDPHRDLVPIALVATGGYLLVVNPSRTFRSVGDLIAAAKTKPDTITYASYGAGSMSHICAEIFQSMTSVKLSHVPYRAGSLNDLVGGHVDIGFEPVGPAIGHVQRGSLTALGSTVERIEALPTVPSLSEAVPGYDCRAWVGVLAPAKTPGIVQKKLSDEIVKIASTPAFAEQMKILGLVARPMPQSPFGEFVRVDAERWTKVIKPLNIRLD